MTAVELLSAWDSPRTEDYVLCRGIDLWKWRCYALAAGVVDGRKWKGAEIARERKLSRARICVVLKEVELKLTEDAVLSRRRLYRRGSYLYLRNHAPQNAISVQEFFRESGGRHEKIVWKCRPDVKPVVFIAEGKPWVFDSASEEDYAIIWCVEADNESGTSGRTFDCVGWRLHYNHLLLVNCGGKFYTLDRIEHFREIARIHLKPVVFRR